MTYETNDYKFIAVLNKKYPIHQLMNALGHMTAGLMTLDLPDTSFVHYQDADGSSHPAISDYPYIILSAKNSNQIARLRNELIQANLPYNDFVHTMFGSSSQAQQQATQQTPAADLDYLGVVTYGSTADLQPLTKRFSVWK